MVNLLLALLFSSFLTQIIAVNTSESCEGKVWCRNANWTFSVYSGQTGGFIVNSGDFFSNVVVSMADYDENGKVDFAEFLNVTKLYLNEAFNMFDSNEDKLINQTEAYLGINSISKQFLIRILKNVFWAIDRNGDGDVSTEDLTDDQYETFDVDQDDSVTLKELLGRSIIMFPSPVVTIYKILDSNKNEIIEDKEQKNFINFLSRIFDVLDRNGDCAVNFEEFLSALDSCGLPQDFQLAIDLALRPYISLANYLVKVIFSEADADENKLINMEEVLNYSDKKMDVKPIEVTSPFLYQPNLVPMWYLGGLTDFYGREPTTEEERTSKWRRAVANWLVTLQGFMRDPAFLGQGKKDRCIQNKYAE